MIELSPCALTAILDCGGKVLRDAAFVFLIESIGKGKRRRGVPCAAVQNCARRPGAIAPRLPQSVMPA